jgi:hypothetical protein
MTMNVPCEYNESCRLDSEVSAGTILLDEVQQFNLHILSGGEALKFR